MISTWNQRSNVHSSKPGSFGGDDAFRVDSCNLYRKKFISVNTVRQLEEGHVRRQAQWKKAKSEDLLAMR